MTAGATPFKNNFLPNTFVSTIENMEGSGGKLKFTATVPSHIVYDQRLLLKLTISLMFQICNFVFLHLNILQQTKRTRSYLSMNGDQVIIHASSSLLLDKRTKTKTIIHRQEISIPVMEFNIGFSFFNKFDKAVNTFVNTRNMHYF